MPLTQTSLESAVQSLARVCDGAIEDDGQGFAGPDTKWGHYFASLPETEWGDDYRYLVHKRLRKYRVQLEGFGIDYDSLPIPTEPTEVPHRLSKWDHQRRQQREVEAKKPRLLTLSDGKIKIEFPYNPELVTAVKKLKGNRRFSPQEKCWYADVAQQNVAGLRVLVRLYKFKVSDDAAAALRNAQTASIGTIKYTNKGFAVHMHDVNWDIVNELRTLRNEVGGQYEGSSQTNYIPDAAGAAAAMLAFVERHKDVFDIEANIPKRLAELNAAAVQENKAREKRLKGAERQESDYKVDGLKIELRPFQRAGVEYVVELANGRSMIADEQGLGKTIEALAAIQKSDAYPVVVVCPSHLKENWAQEVYNVLEGRTSQLIDGRKVRELVNEVIIVNYEILAYHAKKIIALAPKALIIDESQAVKNPDASRTKAVKEIADSLPKKSMILALTGTPIPNRPIELISQLDILGMLEEFGGFKGFVSEYVGWEYNGFGYNFDGAIKSNMPRLNEKLREIGYIRRPKKEVLADLPDIQRSVVPMEMTKDGKANYRQASKSLSSSLRKGDRNTALAEINLLRQAAARGKLESVCKWVETFLESDEKLIVFAHHREIQEGLRKDFPDAAYILSKDQQSSDERTAAVKRFQEDDDCKLIICSLSVANTGLTLTAASNIAFVELGWNPSIHDQAEARCYGRVNDAHGANSYYLLAKGTIDEPMSELIESKRAIVEAAVDGISPDETLDIRGELIEWLKESDKSE